MNEPAVAKPRTRWLSRRGLLRMIERALALFGVVTIIYMTCFDYSRVTSGSMAPTLQGEDWEGGDRVLTEKITYWFRNPRRWEVATLRADNGVQVMKRVIGLPGENVRMLRGGKILINGKQVRMPSSLGFLKYVPYGNLMADKPPVECGDGYYVLGDDTMDSDDSRFNGPISLDQLTGRAWIIMGPSDRRGFVNRGL